MEGDNGSSKILADVPDNRFCVAENRFGIDIQIVLILYVNECFLFYERGFELFFHFVQESGLEGVAQKRVVEMLYHVPETIV